MADVRTASVFSQAHVADPVQAVFDAPMAAIVFQELSRARTIGGETRDTIRNLGRLASLLFDGALDPTHLLEAGP